MTSKHQEHARDYTPDSARGVLMGRGGEKRLCGAGLEAALFCFVHSEREGEESLCFLPHFGPPKDMLPFSLTG